MTDRPALNLDHLNLDAEGRLDQDLICLKCGYNLRGLLPEGRCPECGTAVGRSLHGDWLQYSDPQWVDKLASGMNWIWWSLALTILAPIILPLLINLLFHPTIDLIEIAVYGYVTSICLFWIIGMWLFSTPDPTQSHNNYGVPRPQSIRYILIPFAALSLGFTYFVFYYSPPDLLSRIIVMIMPLLLLSILVVLSLRYASSLARRGGDINLAYTTRLVMRGWCVGWLGILASALVWLSTLVIDRPSLSIFLEIAKFTCFFGCLTIFIFGVWLLRLVDRYYKLMRASAESARSTWAREPFTLVRPTDHR